MIRPARGRCVVSIEQPATVTPGGLLLPPPRDPSAVEKMIRWGRVLAVGPAMWDGSPEIAPGDRVLLSQYDATEVPLHEDVLGNQPPNAYPAGTLVMRQEYVLAVVEDS